MPLEDLEVYGSDSGASGHASNSVDEPKTPQYDTDANATEAESNDGRSEEQKFDGQSDSGQLKNPRGASVRMLSRKLLSVVLIRTTMRVGFLSVTSCSSTVVWAVGAASSVHAFNWNWFRHGTEIMYPQMIIKERLPELWQNLCVMPRPKSPRNITQGQFPICASKR
jgi:hypothetical protein